MNIQAWDEIHGKRNRENLRAFLESQKDSYAILQLKHTDETAQDYFMRYSWLENHGRQPEFDHYDVVYVGELAPETGLEDLFVKFNTDHPQDFTGHSLSVSDIVALKRAGVIICHYTDSIGFREITGFIPENYLRNAEMALEDDYGMIDGVLNNGRRQEPDSGSREIRGEGQSERRGQMRGEGHREGYGQSPGLEERSSVLEKLKNTQPSEHIPNPVKLSRKRGRNEI
ncbi:MAG: YodL domain-containing protein [Lachnospiraceae bacterium]|nr:YodL domain-containing protein [Lachnospiraceae bacterium]